MIAALLQAALAFAGDGALDASEIPALCLRRTLADVELEFVRVIHEPAVPSENVPAHAHCFANAFTFTGGGFIATSRAIDPLVTPRQQMRDGTVLAGGQDLTILFDGAVQLSHEDIPETEEDFIDVEPRPTAVKDADPRQFGLYAVVKGMADRVERAADGTVNVMVDDRVAARVELDPGSGLCSKIEMVACSGSVVGEWRFSDFEWIDAGGQPTLYPVRSELIRYDERDGKRHSDELYLLRSVRARAGVDVAAELRSHAISAASIVRDQRFVPPVQYIVGDRLHTDQPVAFAALAPALLDELERRDAAVAQPAAPTSAESVERSPAWLLGVLALSTLLATLLRGVRRSRALKPSVAGLLVLLAGAGPLRAASEGPAVAAVPAELSLESTVPHASVRAEVEIANGAGRRLTLDVGCATDYVAVWPQSVELEPGARARLVVHAGVPSGIGALDAAIAVRERGAAAGTSLLEIPLRLQVTSPAPPPAPAKTGAPHSADGPRLVCASFVHDAGRVDETDRVSVAYPFENHGRRDLEIRSIVAECGCTRVDIQPRVVPPGGSGVLELVFSADNRSGRLARRVYVTTNDLEDPLQTFVLEADVIPAVTVQPAALSLGTLLPGQTIDAMLSLEFAHAMLPLRAVRAEGLFVRGESMLIEGEARATLAVMLQAGDACGAIDGQILLDFEGRSAPLRVPFDALVRSEVYPEPEQLGFAFIDAAAPERAALEFALKGVEHAVERVEADAARLRVEPVPPRDGERARYRIVPVGGEPGLFRTELRVVLAGGAGSVSMPVRGFVGSRD